MTFFSLKPAKKPWMHCCKVSILNQQFFDWFGCTAFILVGVSCVDTPAASPRPRLWKVAALMRGDRNGTWLLLLCGWSFPLPQRWGRLRLVLRSEVAPFFTPACICQAVIAPGEDSFQSRGRRLLTSHMMLSLFFWAQHAEEGSSLFCPMPMRELLFVLETDECFHVKAGRLRCHGAASADCLDAEILFSQHGIKFHWICCKDDEKYYTVGVFTLHCQECTFFVLRIHVFVCFHPLECPWSVFDVARCRKGALV